MLNKIKNNFGFGVMRLPMAEGEFDKARFCEMVDEFIGAKETCKVENPSNSILKIAYNGKRSI